MTRRLSLTNHRRSKVRGARRKCSAMVESIRSYTLAFPEEDFPGAGSWHLHVPVDQAFIDSQKTPHWVRRQCIQCLIERTGYLRDMKPASDQSIHVVASISLPYLWDSEVIVFLDQEYFRTFFDRDSQRHSWKPLRESRSVMREWGLKMPDGFQERGYHERIRGEDYSHDGEVWFFGELD